MSRDSFRKHKERSLQGSSTTETGLGGAGAEFDLAHTLQLHAKLTVVH